jgi:hypothetical protein
MQPNQFVESINLKTEVLSLRCFEAFGETNLILLEDDAPKADLSARVSLG